MNDRQLSGQVRVSAPYALQVRAPWLILLLTAALVVPKLWLLAPLIADLPPSERITELLFHLLPIPFAVVGTLIATRRPGHRIGWLLLGGSLAIASAQLTWSYVTYSVSSDALLPGSAVVGWVGNWIPWPALTAFALLLLLFPDGQLPSPRWRPVAWGMVAWCAVIMAFLALYPGLISTPKLDNPFGLSGDAGEAMRRLQASPIVPLITIPLFLASASAPLVRFRHARAEQRQQLKWFAYAVGLVGVLLVLPGSLFPGWANDVRGIVTVVAVWGIAAAIGIAVLRYRLYDIDRLINRTLVYGLLTALLGVVYAGSVLVLGQVFGGVRWPASRLGGGRHHPGRRRAVPAGPAAASNRRLTAASTDASTTPPRHPGVLHPPTRPARPRHPLQRTAGGR